jgi:hypothetical protein
MCGKQTGLTIYCGVYRKCNIAVRRLSEGRAAFAAAEPRACLTFDAKPVRFDPAGVSRPNLSLALAFCRENAKIANHANPTTIHWSRHVDEH